MKKILTLATWWSQFKKTAKKLLPLMYFWGFIYVIVALIMSISATAECSFTFTYNIMMFTFVWWLIYLWILCALSLSSKFTKPEMNYKKGYYTMYGHYIKALKVAQTATFKCEKRKLQIRDYADFVNKLIADGRIAKEETVGVIKSRKEYARIVQENKPIKKVQ